MAVVVAISVLAAGCGGSEPARESGARASAPARGATVELPGGRIAFRRYLDEAHTHGAIFTINPDGSDEKQLTQPPVGYGDDNPDWSPDGKRIAFERCAEGEPCQVFTVAADGGGPHKVKASPLQAERDLRPRDAGLDTGRATARHARPRPRTVDPGTGEPWIQQSAIELLDLDTGRQRTIVKRPDWTGDAATPAVSPDGRTVIYKRWNSWRSKPARARDLRRRHRRLQQPPPHALEARRRRPPRLRPGRDDPVPLQRADESKQSDYWTVHPDGTDLTQLTHFKQATIVLSTSYSPDGKWIVHATNGIEANADVFVMRADGTDSRPVTRSKLWDSAPDWGPAGS